MGTDYALVHLIYTIPPAVVLTFLFRPLSTIVDWYKISFLILIAVVTTIPWDSYLIKTGIWSYPPDAVLGPTLLLIPIEELFFFVVQTYNTSLLYLLLNKPTLFPTYLRAGPPASKYDYRFQHVVGQCFLVCLFAYGVYGILDHGKRTYMGLILVWAVPFLLLLWSLAYQLIIGLPWTSTLLPIVIPTLYLWVVDTLALQRGTWVIENGTKLGVNLWPGLEIEEAIFFLATNTLVVFGQIAFDNALAILQAFPKLFPTIPRLPSPLLLMRALLLPILQYDTHRTKGIEKALERLRLKSRSFYLASGVFSGRTRIDLTLLYGFCRVADDLVDEALNATASQHWIQSLTQYLDLQYSPNPNPIALRKLIATFPVKDQAILSHLPTNYLPSAPLYSLLQGFVTDLQFSDPNSPTPFPIATEPDLYDYASKVAGTVSQLFLSTIWHYIPNSTVPPKTRTRCIAAGHLMGIALQYVNIARDISHDALNNRVYLPTAWLSALNPPLTPDIVISTKGHAHGIAALRKRLLDRAFEIYQGNRGAIEELPPEVRGSVRVAVESYMEIGRVILEQGAPERGKATVPRGRRLMVAWRALNGSTW